MIRLQGRNAMPRENYAITVDTWRRLGYGLEANAGDYPHLEGHRLKLDEMTERANTLLTRRNALDAEKQAVTTELQTLLEEGRKVATFLRLGMKEIYGNRSEKLIEFGIRPFRRRSRSTPDGEPTP
jgi:hypothetical protein